MGKVFSAQIPVADQLEGEASGQEKKRKIWKDLLKQVNVVSLTAIEKYILNQKFKMFD